MAIDPYTLISPKPAGPSNTAMTLVRTIPMAMYTSDDPPSNAENIKIWLYVCSTVVVESAARGIASVQGTANSGRERFYAISIVFGHRSLGFKHHLHPIVGYR